MGKSIHPKRPAMPRDSGRAPSRACKEILQYVLKGESKGNTADAEDLYQIASLKGRGHDRECDQEAKQNGCRSGEPGDNHSQVWAVLASSAKYHSAHNNAEHVEQEKDDSANYQRRKSRQETVHHLMSGFPNPLEVGVHSGLLRRARHQLVSRT